MAARGWSAKDLLRPLWVKYPGGRDALAEKIGTTGSALSARNSGERRLGITLARKIADELGVSVLELGAPEGLADPRGKTLLDHLEGLAAKVDRLLEREVVLTDDLDDARTRLAKLESGRKTSQAAPKRQGKAR